MPGLLVVVEKFGRGNRVEISGISVVNEMTRVVAIMCVADGTENDFNLVVPTALNKFGSKTQPDVVFIFQSSCRP